MPTKKEIIEQVRRGEIKLPPLSFNFLADELTSDGTSHFDTLIEAKWKKKTAKFVVVCKSKSTPKAFLNSINQLKLLSPPKGFLPMLVMPFLNESKLLELEKEGISGIDLCGNGVVVVPGRFYIFRSGNKNIYPASDTIIKNIYQNKTSMVARVFFAREDYSAVNEVWAEINRRNYLATYLDKSKISLSTISKSLKSLEEDLIIDRKASIRILQLDKLLMKLSANYTPPKIREKVLLKISSKNETLRELLIRQSRELNLPIAATGKSSVTQYTVMQRGDVLSVYCTRLEKILEQLPGNRSTRFPNLELIETDDEFVYFDARKKNKFRWASPLQVYLELMAGDKRDKETAEQVKSLLLKNIESERRQP